MSDRPQRVEIHEEGPREGFQIEPRAYSLAERAALVEALADAGCGQIQVASFVSPKQVPQMADADDVCAGLPARVEICNSTYEYVTPTEPGV